MDRTSARKTLRVARSTVRTPLVDQDRVRRLRAEAEAETRPEADEVAAIEPLPLAVRVYPAPAASRRAPDRRVWPRPDLVLVFDTETRTDASQRLTFGSYRCFIRGRCMEEGLFYADDLPDADLAVLTRYVRTHAAEVDDEGVRRLQLLTRREFVDKLYEVAYQARGLLVGFNLPFDLSRVAVNVVPARDRFAGGFALELWAYRGADARSRANPHRPRVGIKHIDSKRALIGFTGRLDIDKVDQIPEGSTTGRPDRHYVFRGHFLDLRRLAFALTDEGYSLDTACQAFDVTHGKQRATRHGRVTRAYIDYNRRDVLATWELTIGLLAEYDAHPIALQVTKAYSPASIGKAYLRVMGIPPVLERQPNFPAAYLGYAQSAFFGGRTSAHIRKVPVPVVYTDFLSMYPTVNRLMRLWQLVTAAEVRLVKHRERDITAFLRRITADRLFKPKTWTALTAFVRIIPDGDLLPTRGQYSESHDWQVAVNHLSGTPGEPRDALWFALPDIVASVLRTGRVPKILDAFRVEAHGCASSLTKTALCGAVSINPRRHDFFKVAIEERKRLKRRTDLSMDERARLDKALKVFASATSYGIYAEMNVQESDDPVTVRCHGLDAEPFTCRVAHPEVPGEYCFPPLASLITSAARLMLALLEDCVAEAGTYAMEDTDSMAIVATKDGGLVPCPGGPHRTKDGREAVQALTWAQVEQIAKRFERLSPYDRDAIPGSILKIEDDNFDPVTKRQRQLHCLAISAKRYVLFLKDRKGTPVLLRRGVNNAVDRWSEHGLGHLLNPTDPESDDREWIAYAWLRMIRRALGLSTRPLAFANVPAVGRVTVSSPGLFRPFAGLNDGKRYGQQVKPFNFGLTCFVRPLGHPPGVDAQRFHLFLPYESDPTRWLKAEWVDQYSGKTFHITTTGDHGSRRAARVKTYGELLHEYEQHPEAKCADASGHPCDKQTIGLLQRRHVRVASITYIGKESNRLEEVEAGLVHSAESVYTVYADPRRDAWNTTIRRALQKIPLKRFERLTGKSRRMLIDARTARRRPHRRHQALLIAIARKLGLL